MEKNKNENIPQKKRKGGIVLICGMTLAFFWMFIFPQLHSVWWKICSFLPEACYFQVEEFLALNAADRSSPLILIGGFVIIAGTLFLALKLNGRLQKSYEYILLAVIILLAAAMMLPHLCAPREISRRLYCVSMLKEAYCHVSLYSAGNNGELPDSVTVRTLKHAVKYHGKGRSLQEKVFVILEDAECCHAGDLRHQVLSNGEIKPFYPWKSSR